MEVKEFIQVLKQDIEQKSILKHPFYQMWSEGLLTLDNLKGYAGQYYKIVDTWPQWISAVHSNCSDKKSRQILVKNLAEEELGVNAGDRQHSELWIDFGVGLGAEKDEIEFSQLLPETHAALTIFNNNIRNRSFIESVGALYAYEQQVPEVAKTKAHGLQTFYGITDASTLEFFNVHSTVDVRHAKIWEVFIEKFAIGTIIQEKVRNDKEHQFEDEALLKPGG